MFHESDPLDSSCRFCDDRHAAFRRHPRRNLSLVYPSGRGRYNQRQSDRPLSKSRNLRFGMCRTSRRKTEPDGRLCRIHCAGTDKCHRNPLRNSGRARRRRDRMHVESVCRRQTPPGSFVDQSPCLALRQGVRTSQRPGRTQIPRRNFVSLLRRNPRPGRRNSGRSKDTAPEGFRRHGALLHHRSD